MGSPVFVSSRVKVQMHWKTQDFQVVFEMEQSCGPLTFGVCAASVKLTSGLN